MIRTTKVILLGACLTSALARADVIMLETSSAALGANDSVSWGQLGADGAAIANPFSATSAASNAIGGSFATGSATGLVAEVGSSWGPASGAFANNDFLDWSFNNGTSNGIGPVTFTFPSGFGAGAAIQPDSPGQFTARIDLFNGGTLLGFVTETSDLAGDALYIGGLDTTGANVTKAVFSLTAVGSNPNNETNNLGDFAVDTLSLVNPVVTGIPEPGTFFLLGGALMGLHWRLRRRATRS